jgi:hypothetical protein
MHARTHARLHVRTHECTYAYIKGKPSYTPIYRNIFAMQGVEATGGANAACLAAHTATDDTWRCFFAQYTLPHIVTPLFIINSLADARCSLLLWGQYI